MHVVSIVMITLLILALVISLFYVFKFALIIFRVEDAIEESLDIIDERYRSMSKILEVPLFYDSPQIRQVVNDIKVTRDSLLLVANIFSLSGMKALKQEEQNDKTQED